MNNKSVSAKNMAFWNELCGSSLAKYLGITDGSVESLKKFDKWYFDFYPYLLTHIPFEDLFDKDVLEVGLGYGTVSQRLAEKGAKYTGLDIASAPVAMVNHRLLQNNLNGRAIQGDILKPPFKKESFDSIIAIGCLHHTGNLKLAINQCWRLLRPCGFLIIMVYYAYSYRRFRTAFVKTIYNMAKEIMGYRGVVGKSVQRERVLYDANSSGEGAPHTDWISVRSLRYFCGKFSKFTAKIENIDQEFPFFWAPRQQLLSTRWPSIVGLDLYATGRK